MYGCLYLPGVACEHNRDLKECIESFTPLFGFAPEIAVLDIRGLRSLIGGAKQIASSLRSRLRSAGFEEIHIAIAANPDAAVAAARGLPDITIISPGEESTVLGPLPISFLSPPEELQETLAAWGIRTFAQLAALPDAGIAERLGTEGVELQKLARGLPSKPFVPFRDPEVFEASLELDHPLELIQPLSFVLGRLLNDICGRLREHGLAANEVAMRLALENRTDKNPTDKKPTEWIRTIRLPFATREASTFLKLLQYDITAHPPQAPVLLVHLKIEPVAPRTVQGGLFIPLAPEPEKLELTLARIAAIVGEENIGYAELLDTHRPGAFRMARFGRADPRSAADPLVGTSGERLLPNLAVRLFRPPLPAHVVARGGRPESIISTEVRGNVMEHAGPWRTCGDWWTAEPWARDEWDVALSNGSLYRIYQEGDNGWFIDGSYD